MVSNIIVKDIPTAKELKLQMLEIPGVNNVLINPKDTNVEVGISHKVTEEEIVIIADEVLKGLE